MSHLGASLSPFNRPFSRWTWVSLCLLKQKIMEVVVTTGDINPAKLQSNHHCQQTNTQLFTGQMPFLSPNQQCQIKALKGIISHSMDLLTPSSPGVFQLCLRPLTTPGYLGKGGLHAFHQPSDASTPVSFRCLLEWNPGSLGEILLP